MSEQASIGVTWVSSGDGNSINDGATKSISSTTTQGVRVALSTGRTQISFAGASFSVVFIKVVASGTATTLTYDFANSVGGPLSLLPGDFVVFCVPVGSTSIYLSVNGTLTVDVKVA